MLLPGDVRTFDARWRRSVLVALLLVFLTEAGCSKSEPASVGPASGRSQVAKESSEGATGSTAATGTPPIDTPPAKADPLLLEGLPNETVSANDVRSIRTKLREIALGFHRYQDSRRAFPPPPSARGGQLSWRVHLLPYLDQEPLYRRFDLKEPWDSPNNQALLSLMPDIYRGGDESESSTRFVVFTGDETLFRSDKPGRLRAATDGSSNTLLLVYSGGGKSVPWTKPADADFGSTDPLADLGLTNRRVEGVLLDGSLISLPAEVGRATVNALITPAGKEIVDGRGLVRKYDPTAPPDMRRIKDLAKALVEERTEPAPPPPKPDVIAKSSDQPAAAVESPTPHLSPAANAGPAPSDLSLYPIERAGFDYAYDEASGLLASAEHEANQISIYNLDRGLNLVHQSPAPAKPLAVIAKRFQGKSYFIVGGELDKRVDIFAAESGEKVASVYLPTPTVLQLATSKSADDPFVYYVSRHLTDEGRKSNYYFGRFNFETATDEGFIHEGRYCSISADGSMLYSSSEEQTEEKLLLYRIVDQISQPPVGFGVPPGKASLELVGYTSFRGYETIVGPSNTFVGCGPNLFPARLDTNLGAVEFPIRAFCAMKPWVAGLNKSTLQIASVNDMRTRGSIDLPEEFAERAIADRWMKDGIKFEFTRTTNLTPTFMDERRERTIVASEFKVAVAPWKSLALPDEPLIAAECPGLVKAMVNEPLRIPLKPYDPRVTVRLASAPQGAALKDGVLQWTPTAADIGPADILVECSLDTIRFNQIMRVDVTRPAIDLPFACQYVSLSPDAKFAVVWNQPEHDRTEDAVATGHLALVDIDNKKVLGTRDVDKGIWLARVNAQGVYVLTMPPQGAATSADITVFRLNVPDLTLGASGAAAGFTRTLALVGDKYLAACQEIFDQSTLQRLVTYATTGIPNNNLQPRQYEPPDNRIDGGWYADGVQWDAQATRPLMLDGPQRFARFTPADTRMGQRTSWGRLYQGTDLAVDFNRQLLHGTDASGRGPFVLGSAPAALMSSVGSSASGAEMFVLNVHDVVGGNRIQTIPLASIVRPIGVGSYQCREAASPVPPDFDSAGDLIAACVGAELVFVPVSDIDRGPLRAPFRIRWQQDPLVLADTKDAHVAYELAQGDPPFEVKLKIEGVETRAQTDRTAKLQVNGRLITETVLDRINQVPWPRFNPGANGGMPNGQPGVIDIRDTVLDYVDAVSPYFKLLTGHNPRGVPVMVTAWVEATDRNLQLARMNHVYLLDIPQAQVIRAYNASSSGQPQPGARAMALPRADADRSNDAARQGRARQMNELNTKLAIDFSNDLRKTFGGDKEKIDAASLKQKAAAAQQSIAAFLAQGIQEVRNQRLHSDRSWSDKKGHQTQAKLKELFADQVVLSKPAGDSVTVPIERLSVEDQRFLTESQSAKPSELELTVTKMHLLAKGISKDANSDEFVPGYLVNVDGKPILSWRVAILPYIGGEDLLRLLHLDEPWDSEHNRALVAYMPEVFKSSDAEGKTGKTGFMAFRNDGSLMVDGRAIAKRDLTTGFPYTLVLGETNPSRAVEWTRPDDIPAESITTVKSWLKKRGDGYLVGFLGGDVKVCPSAVSQEEWTNAIDYKDRTDDMFKFFNAMPAPNDASPSSGGAKAKPAPAKAPIVTDQPAKPELRQKQN
jgi:Protein of unknown function (DUF1559)